MVDFSKFTVGDTVTAHVCDNCAISSGFRPKRPADSGPKSWLCAKCEHHGIGSSMKCEIGDWLILHPIEYAV